MPDVEKPFRAVLKPSPGRTEPVEREILAIMKEKIALADGPGDRAREVHPRPRK